MSVPNNDLDEAENLARSLRGELCYAFRPSFVAARARCSEACRNYNTIVPSSRRNQVALWRDIVQDTSVLPPLLSEATPDAAQFDDEPWIEPPIRVDNGTNLKLGKDVYINFNATILDTCVVTIGDRTLLATNVSIYTATHPLDPAVRNGTKGPECGKEISIGSDCFIGGSVVICPGVRIGNGVTVGAGSVVTKDVEDLVVVAGNPARVIRRLEGQGLARLVEKQAKDSH